MADKKISALDLAATPLAGTEVLPIVQSGSTKKVSVDNLTAGKAVSALSVTATNLKTSPAAENLDISGRTIAAAGTSTNIDISVTPKGSGRLLTNGLGTNGAANLGNSGNNLANGGYTHRISGRSISPDGVSFLSSYAAVILNAGADYTGGARRYLVTNAYETNKLAFIRSVDATTDPTIGNAGAVTSGTADLIFSNTGNITVGVGNLVIGTSGKGIDFSATGQATGMTSELFSDYEEGTWSPGLSSAGGAFTSVTFDSSTGKYTKIGRTVYVSGSFFTSGAITVGSASGQVYITGLPFTVGEAGVGNVWFNPDSANYNQPTALATGCVANSTQLQLFKNGTVNNPAFVVSELYTGGGPGNNYLFEATYQV